MAKAKFDRSKPHVNIGTIGHVDHGKTKRPKKRLVVSQSTLPTSSIRPTSVTMRTLTARATPTMSKT